MVVVLGKRPNPRQLPARRWSESITRKVRVCFVITSKSRESENAAFEGAALFNKILCQTWQERVFEYDPESKRQSSEWHTASSPKPKKARMSKSRVKSMLITFFDAKGVIFREFVPAGQTVNGQYYADVIRRLKDRVHRVRPEKKDDWVLHHDNAPVHTCFAVTQILARNKVATLPQPPYSPDLAPSDFFLFPRMKKDLKGKRFGTIAAVQAASTKVLNNIQVEEFQEAFRQWKTRWQRCVDSEGNYFEDF